MSQIPYILLQPFNCKCANQLYSGFIFAETIGIAMAGLATKNTYCEEEYYLLGYGTVEVVVDDIQKHNRTMK
jgi:hypothetical protein